MYLFTNWVTKLTVVIFEEYHGCQRYKNFYRKFFPGKTPYADEITGNHSCGFGLKDQIL